MAKAILELKMPANCWQCELYSTAHNCCNVIVIVGHYAICPSKGRRSDCPLKPVDTDMLEKQKPKKVIETPDKHKYGYCPVCGRIYWDKCHIGNYCDSCGQRLEVEHDGITTTLHSKKEMMPNDARQNANRKDYKLKQPVK